MISLLKKFYHLGWKTSLEPAEYLWYSTLLALISSIPAIFAVITVAFYIIFVQQQAVPHPALSWILIGLMLLVFVITLVINIWFRLKLVVNRVHSFGYRALWPIIGYIATLLILAVLSNLYELMPALAFLAAGASAIFTLTVSYFMFMESGKSTRFPPSDVLVVSSWGWGKTALTSIYLFIVIIPSVLTLLEIL